MSIARPAPDTEHESILETLTQAEQIAFHYLAGVLTDQLKRMGMLTQAETAGNLLAGRLINEFDRNHDSGTNDITGPPACLAALANLWDQCETAEYTVDGGRLRPIAMVWESDPDSIEGRPAE